jgi:acyl carrier protein
MRHPSDSAATALSSMMDDAVQAIIGELKRLILEVLKIPIEEAKLDPHVPLLDGGLGLDSITLFELITLIEQRYAVTFPVENLNSKDFATLAVVARQVHSLLDQNHTAGATS